MPDEIGTPAEGAAPSTEAPSSGVDFSPVLDRVSELAGSIDGRFAALEQRIPQPEQPQEPDPWSSLFPEEPQEPQFDPYAGQQPQAQHLDPQALQAAFQQAQQQANAPLMAEIQALRTEKAREQLLTNIPALKDPKVANETEQAMIAAYQAAGQTRDQIAAALASPFHISQFFKAAEAEKLAAGQAPATSDVPQLEAAGGATPGGNGEQPNIAQTIFANRSTQVPPAFR